MVDGKGYRGETHWAAQTTGRPLRLSALFYDGSFSGPPAPPRGERFSLPLSLRAGRCSPLAILLQVCWTMLLVNDFSPVSVF